MTVAGNGIVNSFEAACTLNNITYTVQTQAAYALYITFKLDFVTG